MKKRSTSVNAGRARWRGTFLLACFALAAVALEGRILYLQLVNKDFLTEQANDRHLRTVQISAHRGSITDRYGEPLAVSTPVDSIWANPQQLKPALDRLPELAAVLGQDDEWLARRITSNLDREFVYLQRHLPPNKSEQVLKLGLPGVGTLREYRRYYPAGEVTGHVLGFTDVDDTGQEGLELAFDYWLNGESGSKRVLQDRLGRIIDDVELIKCGPSRARPSYEPRSAAAISCLSGAQARRRRGQGPFGLGRHSRPGFRRSARHGQPAVLQPERSLSIQPRALSQPGDH